MRKESETENLARMVADGFLSMDKKFGSMEKRFDGVDARFDSLEKEVRLTNQHIDRVVMSTLDSHAARIKNLELKFT